MIGMCQQVCAQSLIQMSDAQMPSSKIWTLTRVWKRSLWDTFWKKKKKDLEGSCYLTVGMHTKEWCLRSYQKREASSGWLYS